MKLECVNLMLFVSKKGKEIMQVDPFMDRLSEILKKYQGYKIQLEGHAVMIYWDQPARAITEQEEVLLPLSRERAKAIKDALVQRGVRADRMSTTGYGGQFPVVPHGDLDNRWKNRRVEFILIKQ